MKTNRFSKKIRAIIGTALFASIGTVGISNAQNIYEVSQKYNNYDINGDGKIEIESLQPYLGTTFEVLPSYQKVVTILVEERLISNSYSSGQFFDFYTKLRRYAEDLRLQGFAPRVLTIKLHTGPGQDGRTLLAIREFFKAVKTKWPNFQGAMLVGAFPDAFINQTIISKVAADNTEYLSINPGYNWQRNYKVRGIYGERSDIVLGDLDGNWEKVYHESADIEAIEIDVNKWPAEGGTVSSSKFARTTVNFKDIFWLDDADYQVIPNTAPNLSLKVSYKSKNKELSTSDLSLPNPVARPEISISRINARNVAYDANRLRDPKLEIQLLMEYFDRNHNHRVGGNNNQPFRAAAIASEEFTSGWRLEDLNKASSSFSPGFFKDQASIEDYKLWLKNPALLRGIMAHSSARLTTFKNADGVKIHANGDFNKAMWAEKALKDAGSSFVIHGGCQVNSPMSAPSLSFMDYGLAQNSESILIYLNSLAVMSRAKVYYDWPTGFAEAFGATESSTFGDGWKSYFTRIGNLSLDNSRAHDFKQCYFWGLQGDWSLKLKYDKGIGILGLGPEGLKDEAIVSNNSFINFWHYSNNSKIIGKGDFTGDGLDDIIHENAYGGIAFVNANYYYEMKLMTTVSRYSSPGGFSLLNAQIKAIGDINGDKIDDIVMVNSNGMAIFTIQNNIFTPLLVLNNDNWVGGWRYHSSNTIHGLGDFDNDGRKDILITSPWGVGVIKHNGSFCTTQLALPNGTWFGGWNFSSVGNIIKGIADLNGDNRSEIIVTSPWGMGVLTLNGTNNSFTSLAVVKNGTNIGSWPLNTTSPDWGVYPDYFATYGDFDGDKGEEIVLANVNQGLGLITMKNGILTSLVKANNDSWFGGWRFSAANKIVAAKDMNGDNKAELIISSPWGLGVLNYTTNWFSSLSVTPYGRMLGNWRSESGDEIAAIGKFSYGKGGNKILLKKNVPSSSREEFSEAEITTSLNEEKSEQAVSAYPMPFTETFNLKSELNGEENLSVEITDIEGKLIYSNKNYSLSSQIGLGDNLPKGTYILKVTSSKKTDIQKIIKL